MLNILFLSCLLSRFVCTEIELEEEAERQGVSLGIHSTISDRVLSEAG